MTEPTSLKKPLLYALIASVVLGAGLGIILVLRNEWGWYEVRVILTTVIIAVASLCGLACDLSKTPIGTNLLPKSGLAMTGLAAALMLIGMWSEIESDSFWKLAAVVSILGVATVHVCLLSIAQLERRFQWVYFVACQIIFGLAAILSFALVFEIDSDELWRIVAAISIVVAALTLVIPILHRIGRMSGNREPLLMPIDARNVADIDEQILQLEDRIKRLSQLRSKILREEIERKA